MDKKFLTKEKLTEFVRYDAQTGIFYRKATNKRADTHMNIGYRRVRIHIDGVKFELLAHRLAWLMFYGEWPTKEIDHIDGDRQNNSIYNLRHVDRTKNARNTSLRQDNTSGASGLSQLPYGAWRVRIATIQVGCYETKDQALAARAKYLLENGYTQRHGVAQ